MTIIKPPAIKKWIQCFTPDSFLAAGADVYGPQYGSVGQHIGYVLYATPDMKTWDPDAKAYAIRILEHPHRRINALYTRKDLHNDQSRQSQRPDGPAPRRSESAAPSWLRLFRAAPHAQIADRESDRA